MKISEILQAFHRLQACDRMDLICRMLRHCVAFESRFLGTVLLDASKEHYKSQVNRIEINANRVNYYKPFQESGMSHEVCEKLCCALAVVHSDNHPVAEVIFNLLDDKKVLSLFEECNEHKVLQDFRLLYVMAVNHPALSFNQRQLLMYSYLQRMDLLYIEKSKYSFSGSFSGSVEKTLSVEGEASKYPPEIQFSSPAPDAYITRCEVHSVYRRPVDKRYVYMIQVEWSDGATYTVRRTYGDFFSFQTKLLDLFPEEGGQKGKKHPRMIPFLPGKNYQRFLKSRETAEKRLPELHRYSRELISLPEHIHRSEHVLEFFRPRPSDKTEDYPPLHKITTLYDLLESGKVRSRVFSEPLRGSPTHSPITHPRGSPLQRASLSTSTEVSPSTPPRVSQTLPPPAHSPLEAASDSNGPVIPRRPTYPLNRKSAFTTVSPIGASSLSEDELASTATLTMAVSEVSIAGGQSSDCHTPTSHLSSSSTSLTAPTLTPTSTHPPQQSHQVTSTTHSPKSTEKSTNPSQGVSKLSNLEHPPQRQTPTQGRESVVSSTQQHYISTESPLPRHPVAVLQHQPQPTGVPLTVSNTVGLTQLVPVQQTQVLVSTASPCVITHDGQVMYTQGVTLFNARGAILSSPTSPTPVASSPLVPSSARPSINSPSPTLSGTTTPQGGYLLNTGYPSNQIINVGTPFSQLPYQYLSGSPLASPVPSPKTPKGMYGSYNAVNRPPSEHDSLMKWLKSLRLHKYHSMFDNITFDEMCSMSVEQLETRGMTQGAAKKLFRKLEELKGSNFRGFHDMPVAPGMSRMSSTCSLPASLLMERGLTPSSSFEGGFSPTGSTCSLDKYGQSGSGYIGRMPTPSQQSHRHSGNHEQQHSRSSCSSAVIEDEAIVKVVPLLPGRSEPNLLAHNDHGTLMSENPVTSTPKSTPRKNSKTTPPTPPPKQNHLSADDSRLGAEPTSSNTSWADLSGSSEGSGRPDWAQMPANGEARSSPHKHIQSQPKISGGVANTHHIIPIKTHPEQTNPFQQYTSQERSHLPSKPHPPSRARHTPVAKRNSSEGHPNNSHEGTPYGTPATVRHKQTSNRTDQFTPPHHDMLHSGVTVIRPHPSSPHVVHHRVSPQYPIVNGALKAGMIGYGGARVVNYRPEPVAVTCFNCGKRGHIGMTCPANTMDTNDPGTFHKKLETLVHSTTASKSPVL